MYVLGTDTASAAYYDPIAFLFPFQYRPGPNTELFPYV